MKKALLFSCASLLTLSSFAQTNKGVRSLNSVTPLQQTLNTAAKTTGDGDTSTLIDFNGDQLDSLTNYYVGAAPFDSGFVYGANPFGDKAWAERFDINPADSGVKVIGTMAIFNGTYAPGTTKTVSFYVWAQGPRTTHSSLTAYQMTGIPTTTLATLPNVNISTLGINLTGGADSFYTAVFPSATASLTDSFFVGYGINYDFSTLNGDTIGIMTTRDGYRYSPYYYVSGTDTTINTKNATQFSDGTWHENNYDNFTLANHLAVFPIVIADYSVALAVHGVVKNNLEFFGNYPNPANNSTNIRIALSKSDDVTVTIMDMSGRTINTIVKNGLGAGEHTINVETSNLASGSYLYLVRTSAGDGMASKFEVVK